MKQVKEKFVSQKKDENTKRNVAVIPYVHKFSHCLKKVGARYGVQVVFSAPNRLGKICAAVHNKLERSSTSRKGDCITKHQNQFVPCASGVVYSIPVTCGRCYIGQTGRCLNTRLREHKNNLSNNYGSHLAAHCKGCKCTPLFHKTTVIFRHRDDAAREVMEAFFIKNAGESCISSPSVALSRTEISFLEAG